MPPTIYIDLDVTGRWFILRCPYLVEFNKEMKARVPSRDRRWIPEEAGWCIDRRRWEVVERLLRKHFGHEAEFEVGPAAEAAQIDLLVDGVMDTEPTALDYRTLSVRTDAPLCVIHAAYHALEQEKLFDPISDNILLRAAYERICRQRDVAPQDPEPRLEIVEDKETIAEDFDPDYEPSATDELPSSDPPSSDPVRERSDM